MRTVNQVCRVIFRERHTRGIYNENVAVEPGETDVLAYGPIVKEEGMLARRAVLRHWQPDVTGPKYVVHWEQIPTRNSPCMRGYSNGVYTDNLDFAWTEFSDRVRRSLGLGKE